MAARKISEKDGLIWKLLKDPDYRVDAKAGRVMTRIARNGRRSLKWRPAGRVSVSRGGLKSYRRLQYKGEELYEGRIIFAAAHGHLDPFKVVDHGDNVGTNNRPKNLRQLTHSENLKSGFQFYRTRGLGARQARQKWISSMEGEFNA